MLRKREELKCETIPEMKGGKGVFIVKHIASSEEMRGKVNLYAEGTLPPKATVGYHTHNGTMEICFFMSGNGVVEEKEDKYVVTGGDVSICFPGESHLIKNTGMEDLKYMVLVLPIEEEKKS